MMPGDDDATSEPPMDADERGDDAMRVYPRRGEGTKDWIRDL